MVVVVIMIVMISIRRRTRRIKMRECSKKQDFFAREKEKNYRLEMPLAVIALPSGNASLHVRKGVGRWKR